MNFTLFKNVSNYLHNGFGVTYNELVDTLDAVGVPSTSRFDHFPPHGPHQQIHRSDPPKQFGRHRSETRLISEPFLLCFCISCASGIYHQFSLGNPPRKPSQSLFYPTTLWATTLTSSPLPSPPNWFSLRSTWLQVCSAGGVYPVDEWAVAWYLRNYSAYQYFRVIFNQPCRSHFFNDSITDTADLSDFLLEDGWLNSTLFHCVS